LTRLQTAQRFVSRLLAAVARPSGARLVAALACLGVLWPGGASAQDFVTPVCRGIAPALAIKFDDATHRAWYRRFWSGQCQGLGPFTCFAGYPNWNAVVAQLAAEAAPGDRARATAEICQMGQVIGVEWARDNAIRRISTEDLRRLTKVLDGAGPLETRLQQTSAKVRLLLTASR